MRLSSLSASLLWPGISIRSVSVGIWEKAVECSFFVWAHRIYDPVAVRKIPRLGAWPFQGSSALSSPRFLVWYLLEMSVRALFAGGRVNVHGSVAGHGWNMFLWETFKIIVLSVVRYDS